MTVLSAPYTHRPQEEFQRALLNNPPYARRGLSKSNGSRRNARKRRYGRDGRLEEECILSGVSVGVPAHQREL